MCVLCLEIAKEQMTPMEIARAYKEAIEPDSDHWVAVMLEIDRHSDLKKVAEAMSELRRQDERL